MENLEFIQSETDPYLFIRRDMTCLVYVDDFLFFSPGSSNFESTLIKLRDSNLSLQKDSYVTGFLGFHLAVNSKN